MKQLGQPDAGELAKYQQFIDGVVWGGLQYADGPRQYAVRKSLFYYEPDQLPAGYYRSDFNWTSWTSWKKEATEVVDRSYNYPHVAALHWTMYRLARNHVGLVTNHPWELVPGQGVPDVGRDGRTRAALRAVRPDGRHGLPGDPARPPARGLDARRPRTSRRG